jgi:hypothetical protein
MTEYRNSNLKSLLVLPKRAKEGGPGQERLLGEDVHHCLKKYKKVQEVITTFKFKFLFQSAGSD